MTIAVVLVLVLLLAAVNGSNDVPKGVATLAGAGVTRYRTAIVWGTITTAAGCLSSLLLASKLTKLFSKGIVTAKPTDAFAIAVLTGTASWVALATWRRLPVSTTHAIIGSLVGAGLLLDAGSVAWHVMPDKLLRPLLLSIVVAFGVSAVVVGLLKLLTPRPGTAVDAYPSSGGQAALPRQRRPRVRRPAPSAPSARATATIAATEVATTEVATDVAADPATAEPLLVESDVEPDKRLTPVAVCHWLTSGATGFARGLNDTPKLVAIGAFALLPRGMTTTEILVIVTVAMAAGSIIGGMRIAERLGTGVVKMNHTEGFGANLTTAALVGLGAWRGWPMSTTHVSTGAIAGSAGASLSRLSGKTLRDFAIAWTVTPVFSALVAAGVYLVLR